MTRGKKNEKLGERTMRAHVNSFSRIKNFIFKNGIAVSFRRITSIGRVSMGRLLSPTQNYAK